MSKAKIQILPALSQRYTLILLAAIAIVTLVLRVVYPFRVVYGYGFTNFLETDAWNRMMYAKSMASMSFFDSIGYMVSNNLLFSWMVSVLGRFLPIEHVGVWLPPFMAVGVIVGVYFIGKNLFDKNIGLISALFVAVIPSEFLHRSLLGFADHHVLEVLLMVLIILFLIKAIQQAKFWNRYTLLAGIMLLLYMLNWKSGIYVMGGSLILILAALLIRNLLTHEKWYFNLLPIVLIGAVGLLLYLPIGGYRQLLFMFPGSEAQAVTTTGEIVSTVFQAPSQRTISELMPLLYPYGKFNLGVVISNLHLFTFAFLVGFYLIWRYRTKPGVLLFAVWTVIMLVLTLNERRFLYYLTLNVGLLSAFAVFEIAKKLKGKVFQNAVILAIPLLLVSLPFSKGIGAIQPYLMTPEWHGALVWLKQQPTDGGGMVSAWGDYGHWIKYVSEKTPNYLPGPGGNLLAEFYLSRDAGEAKQYLDELNTSYLIVDETMLTKKYRALTIYAGEEVAPKASLMYSLYIKQYPDYLRLDYESNTIKIYRYLR